MQQPSRSIELALLLLLSFLWGGSFTLVDVAVESVPPATIVLCRLTIGACLLALLALSLGYRFPNSPSLWGALLIQGVLQSALPFTLISWGQKHIDSGMAGLLNTTPPLFVFLIGLFMLKDRKVEPRRALGVLVGFAGVLIILGPAAMAQDHNSVLGQLAVTAASLSYAVAALYARRFADLPPILTAACSMAFAAVLMLPIAMTFDAPLEIAPTKQAIYSILALGVFSTAVAMVIYFRLVRTLGALGVTTGSYLRAGFSVLLGVVFLGEVLTLSLVAGLLTILFGVALTTGHLRWSLRGVRE
ncbi:MAG: DMT family transporter [Pseudomonadota bacterium]